jgi:sarcosine oxidase gamma subunit
MVGQCLRTRLAHVPVVILCLDEAPRYELWVARSYREYLRSWLHDAAPESPPPT